MVTAFALEYDACVPLTSCTAGPPNLRVAYVTYVENPLTSAIPVHRVELK